MLILPQEMTERLLFLEEALLGDGIIINRRPHVLTPHSFFLLAKSFFMGDGRSLGRYGQTNRGGQTSKADWPEVQKLASNKRFFKYIHVRLLRAFSP